MNTALCETCGEPLSTNEQAQEFRVHIACIPATQRRMTQPNASSHARWLPWRWLTRRRLARLHMEGNYRDAQRRRLHRLEER